MSATDRFDPATGLARGTFGIGTYRESGGAPFPGLVLPDGAMIDLSPHYRDTHAVFDDWERAFDARGLGVRGHDARMQFAEVEASRRSRIPICSGPDRITGSTSPR